MHNGSNQRDQHSFIFPAIPLFTYCWWRDGGGVEKNNPAHLEEPFISQNSERPYIGNKRNKPKRHLWFCWNPVQFHCPLLVLLLIHCLIMSCLFETTYTAIKARWNNPLQKYWFEGLCPLGLGPKRHRAHPISMDFMAPFGTSQNGFHLQEPIGPWKQLHAHSFPKPAGSDCGIARTKFTAVCQLCLITYHV